MRYSVVGLSLAALWIGTLAAVFGGQGGATWASAAGRTNGAPLTIPVRQASELRKAAPRMLELFFMTDDISLVAAAAPSDFEVTVDGRLAAVTRVGIRQRVTWASLRTTERQMSTSVFLELAAPVPQAGVIRVSYRGSSLPDPGPWDARVDRDQVSAALHVSQAGYLPGLPKQALVGLYLGTLGELSLEDADTFLVEDLDGREQLRGSLVPRPDRGMPGAPPAYQQVRMADFSALSWPGVYRLRVPGLGVSTPFRIEAGIAAAYARAYALGLYHQRCGVANALPFTRFVHAACHLARAEIPQPGYARSVDARLDAANTSASDNPLHTAPPLRRLADALYPPVLRHTIDAHGGHHDAGDYGKYALNSALFIHTLVFAVDAFPGVRQLDNLGLPESGDGIGDLLQIAHWETEFLARMQDSDGGFFYMVQPRDRSYEDNVLPDQGDPQVVFPKNTTATAAAVAALAQAGSSPVFRQAYPADALRYLSAAQRGWQFLQRAWTLRGRRGAYQKVRNYGETFEDRDEIVWAATELFLATGDAAAHALLLREFDPVSVEVRRWGWWALTDSYGAAARSYAFARQTGRGEGRPLATTHLALCREAIRSWGTEVAAAARDSAYGTSYPAASKRGLLAGWYFSENNVFDLLVAHRLGDGPALDDAIASNLAFLAGANPPNVSYVTGLGATFPRELVSQYAQNDRRVLPPSGVPVGNLQQGLPLLTPHGRLLREASLPPDEGVPAPYPIYDRWSDVFNTMAEATIVDQARALASAAALMAETPLARQPYRTVTAQITGLPPVAGVDQRLLVSVEVDAPDLDLAEVVWEWGGEPVRGGRRVTMSFPGAGPAWAEVEVVWPDGRRAFAAITLEVR